jgi:hypothetical protein
MLMLRRRYATSEETLCPAAVVILPIEGPVRFAIFGGPPDSASRC